MDDPHKLIVGFSDGTRLEILDVDATYENLVAGFIRVETGDEEWIFFFDKMKYLVQVPQSLKGVRTMSDEEYEEALGEIDAMLQRCVKYWKRSDKECAEYYIDAYQCVQENIKTIKTELQIFIPQSSKGSTNK